MRNIIYQLLNSCHPLPIELLSFDVHCGPEHTDISWTTASETNNQCFTVQRSDDGVDYISIGTTEGAGNSNSPTNYTFVDYNPVGRLSYYRLKQVDYDGNFEYFGPLLLNSNCYDDQTNNINLLNNPAGDELAFQYFSSGNENVEVAVYNMSGVMLLHKGYAATEGTNGFAVDISSIPGGVYLLSITTSGSFEKIKFIKK
jgi:hypothetical protein